ncbi:MAG: hypothetical protein NTX87_15285 [Planctomycetota bacterium]|nr:hypothetical protein [Planctomycetota bacterium]
MSLLTFVKQPDVAARLKPFLPKVSRTLPVSLRAVPRTGNFARVGTAFDYLLRFEIQRRAPHARAWPWVAEEALKFLSVGRIVFLSKSETMSVSDNLVRRACEVVKQARATVADFVVKKRASSRDREEAAFHALRLASLDTYLRRRYLDWQFDQVDPQDIQDLLNLLAIVPFPALIDPTVLLLNPTFGNSSRLVGGADADLITGSTVIDIKTKKPAVWTPPDFNQVLGYLVLARNERRTKRAFPVLNRIGIYFSRHGHLWTCDVASMVRTKAFREVERWFLKRAEAQSAAVQHPPPSDPAA